MSSNPRTELATRPSTGLLPDTETWKTMLNMADALFRSGLLPSSIKSPQAAVAVIQKGTELGIPPMYALSNIVVIQGKPTANAELMLALIYRDHGDNAIVFTHSDNTQCEVAYKRRSWSQARTYSFTMADARTASLLGNQTWQKYPAAMLRARCISAVARMAFPDSIGGMHTPEEIGADVDVVDGEVVIVQPKADIRPLVRESRETINARELHSDFRDVQVDVETGAVVEERGIVDVLTDEMDAPQVDPQMLAMKRQFLAELPQVSVRSDLSGYRKRIEAAGLWDDPDVYEAFTDAYERLGGRRRSQREANPDQPELIEG